MPASETQGWRLQELVTKKLELAEMSSTQVQLRHDLLWEQQKTSALEAKLARMESLLRGKGASLLPSASRKR